jgi:hypothetical protein
MDKQMQFPDGPGLDGPDYVALVIDWDELAETIEDEDAEVTNVEQQPRFHRLRLVAATLGALGVLGLAAWGVHRIRTA